MTNTDLDISKKIKEDIKKDNISFITINGNEYMVADLKVTLNGVEIQTDDDK